MKKLCALCVLVVLFAGQALADKGTFVAPVSQAPATSEGEFAAGKWTAFDYGKWTVARDNETVLIASTWDPMTEKPEDVYNWRADQFKKAPPVAAKLGTKLMNLPGVVNVIIAKHRIEIYRANIYTWEILLEKIMEILKASELTKTP